MMKGVGLAHGEPSNVLQVTFHVAVMATALTMFAYAIGVVRAVYKPCTIERKHPWLATDFY